MSLTTHPKQPQLILLFVLAGFAFVCLGNAALLHAAGDAAVEALLKKSNCLKCHALDKKKNGPPFKETANKYRDKADAEQKLYTHLTTNPKIKIDDKEELHDSLKTKNEADIRNVARWILTR